MIINFNFTLRVGACLDLHLSPVVRWVVLPVLARSQPDQERWSKHCEHHVLHTLHDLSLARREDTFALELWALYCEMFESHFEHFTLCRWWWWWCRLTDQLWCLHKQQHLLLSPYLHLAMCEMSCWSGGREILIELSLCHSILYHYNTAIGRWPGWLTIILQCYYTVGLAVWPIKWYMFSLTW